MTVRKVTPYLYYEDAGAALDWLQRAFGFGDTRRLTGPDGRVAEAEIAVGDDVVMMCGRKPGPDQGAGAMLIVSTDDVDALHAHLTSQGVDATPPKDESYGPRSISVTDPWGYRWYFWQGEAVYPENDQG